MPRKKTKSLKRTITPDVKYQSVLVAKLINKVMKDGKRSLAERLVYGAFDIVKEKTKADPVVVFEEAVKNIAPALQVKSRRIGGANYQIPVEVKGDRRIHLALTWMLIAARARSGAGFDKLLADEILSAKDSQGEAVRKKEETHKMAESNKAFAHFARY